MPEKDATQIAVGILLDSSTNTVLLTRRRQSAHQAGHWEFPGGKREAGETLFGTLSRELREEVGVDVLESKHLISFNYRYPDRELHLSAWLVRRWSGEPAGNENQALQWLPVAELAGVSMPPANRMIIRALQLPEICFITPDLPDYGDDFVQGIASIIRTGVGMVQFRSSNLTGRQRYEIACSVRDVCRSLGCLFVYNGSPEAAVELEADGVHLPSRLLAGQTGRPLDRDHYVSVACHNRDEVAWGNRIGADLCLIGPVQKTSSHPETEPLGWQGFAVLARQAAMPAFALGGLRRGELEASRHHHGHGIAMISGLWESEKGKS